MASTYLTKNLSTATDLKTWTWSAWIKRSKISTEQGLFSADAASTYTTSFFFDTSDRLQYKDVSAGSTRQQLITNRVFRDTSSWYNIQVVYNSTEGTASNRLKFYVNGSQETSFSTATYPSLNETVQINGSDPTGIGKQPQSTSNNFDGSMAHVHFIDGTAYDADTFGNSDPTTGIWVAKTAPSVTYGTNGFFLKGENSSALGTDSSGNANNFTVNGTPTQTVDTPSNVFATLNALDKVNVTLSNGNLNASCASSSGVRSTFGVTKGKYYIEAKYQSTTSMCGVTAMEQSVSTFNGTGALLFGASGSAPELFLNGTAPSTYSSAGAFSANDIMQIALDMDSNTVYFGKNGSWFGGTSWTESTPTTGHTLTSGYTYGVRGSTGSGTSVNIWNFGNGFFGTTAVASAGTSTSGDDSIWEYDCPTGYYGLNTKNINEQEYS